jgi:hypothetical protein
VPWRNLLLGCSGTSRFEQLNPESKGPKRRRMKERKKGKKKRPNRIERNAAPFAICPSPSLNTCVFSSHTNGRKKKKRWKTF